MDKRKVILGIVGVFAICAIWWMVYFQGWSGIKSKALVRRPIESRSNVTYNVGDTIPPVKGSYGYGYDDADIDTLIVRDADGLNRFLGPYGNRQVAMIDSDYRQKIASYCTRWHYKMIVDSEGNITLQNVTH